MQNKFITNFNSNVLPNNLAKLANESLDTVNFSTDDISKTINNLDPNKAHGHEMLSVRIIKLCGSSICKPLSTIFNDCLKEGNFPSDWKKARVAFVHKKEDKQFLKVIDLFPYFQSAVKFLSVSIIISFSPFFFF